MRVPTSTTETQGQHKRDFCYCVEGELVRIDEPCARDRDDPNGGCGCGRAFAGLSSSRATTTAVVRDLDMSLDDLWLAVLSSLQHDGWLSDPPGDAELATVSGLVKDLVELGQQWPAGTVIRRRLDVLLPVTMRG